MSFNSSRLKLKIENDLKEMKDNLNLYQKYFIIELLTNEVKDFQTNFEKHYLTFKMIIDNKGNKKQKSVNVLM